MGFSTSAMFCLMSDTPEIRCKHIAKFIQDFRDLEITKMDSVYPCRIKLGESIDQDDRELIEQLPVLGVRGTFQFRSQQCEIETERDETLDELIKLLGRTSEQPVYRAEINLGHVHTDFHKRVYEPSDKNDRAVSMDSWMLHIGPQIVSDSHSVTGDRFHLGYLSVSLGGQGYCMPRSSREVMDTVRAQPETVKVEQLCKAHWPTDAYEADSYVIAMRTAMGNLWPYDEIDRPVEWNWVIEESF